MISITVLAFLAPITQGVRVAEELKDANFAVDEVQYPPCAPEEWSLRVHPRVFVDADTHMVSTIMESVEMFSLPESRALADRASIYEAACPAHARHPDGIATFNCEQDGRWRMTKETCTHSSSDCFERDVEVTTEDGHTHVYHFLSGDNGAQFTQPCHMGPWNTGTADFICDGPTSSWRPHGELHCERSEEIERDVVQCNEEAGYRVTVNGVTAEYTLPEGDFGESASLGCNFGPKTEGQLTFRCQNNGDWVAVSQDCADPNEDDTGTCRARNKRLSMGGRIWSFPLERGQEGSLVEMSCDNNMEQTASFTCSERRGRFRWRLTRNNCLD